MAFSVLLYAILGYAIIVLASMLVVGNIRGPVSQARPRHTGARPQLRPWPRAARRCSMRHESSLPLRSAQLARRHGAPSSCPALTASRRRWAAEL